MGSRLPAPPKGRITPDPCLIMCRAAALEVRNCVLTAFMIGRSKSSSGIWASGEEDLGPLAGEGTGYRATNRPSPSVDDGVLVLEEHFHPPYPSGCGHPV